MELRRIELSKSPEHPDRVRLVGEVAYGEGGRSGSEVYWFEFPSACGDRVDQSGNPWLACLLPLAATLGEPLRLCAPVDPHLVEGCHEVQRIWQRWYPHLSPVAIEADLQATPSFESGDRVAAFFSGGVDSFCTLLQHVPGPLSEGGNHPPTRFPNLTDLITIFGFDVPLGNPDAFYRMYERHRSVASCFGLDSTMVATNLRACRWGEADWGNLAHGPGLASVALLLGKVFSHVYIASSFDCKFLPSWGSHPLLDPLFSCSHTTIVHDGVGLSRLEKMKLVAQSEKALEHLHVCWLRGDDTNCSACRKCYRTMAVFDVLGVLDKCKTFDLSRYDPRLLARIRAPREYGIDFNNELKALALAQGRTDIARLLDCCLKNNKRANFLLSAADLARRGPLSNPLTRSAYRKIERFVRRRMIEDRETSMAQTGRM